MSGFRQRARLDPLLPQELRARDLDSQLYVLADPLVYESDAFGVLTVPAGLETDFASIPRGVWAILDPEDPIILYPSIVHDWLYTVSGLVITRPAMSRPECDAVLHEAMLACGASRWKAFAVHAAVSRFGSSHWVKIS